MKAFGKCGDFKPATHSKLEFPPPATRTSPFPRLSAMLANDCATVPTQKGSAALRAFSLYCLKSYSTHSVHCGYLPARCALPAVNCAALHSPKSGSMDFPRSDAA
jgi:hypothetical protein